MRRLIIAALALIASPAAAQVVNPPTLTLPANIATKAQLDAIAATAATKADIDAISAAMPKPGNTVPTEQVGGYMGSATTTFMRSDAKPDRITRAGSCVLSVPNGTCTVTWSTPFATGTNVNLVLTPINTGTQPVICNPSAMPTITTSTVRCWFARSLPATLTLVGALVSYDVFGQPAVGMTVQIIGVPATQ